VLVAFAMARLPAERDGAKGVNAEASLLDIMFR
jgi:hypothetical protein